MKSLLLLFTALITIFSFSQNAEISLADYTLTDPTSPAFLILEESPTEIYTPNNLKPMIIHALNNFDGGLSVEFVPYFFTKDNNRTYFKYIGVYDGDNLYDISNPNPNIKQKPFSGIFRTLSISGAYVDKKFSGIEESRKTYSIGLRTTLIRFYDKNKVYKNALELSDKLSTIDLPKDLISKRKAARLSGDSDLEEFYQKAITTYYEGKEKKLLQPFLKTVKPLFKVDGAIGYSALFNDNDIASGTSKRFGSWLIAESTILLNGGIANRKYNNYFNIFALGRYVEDDFNLMDNGFLSTSFYRDLGGKIEFEFGKFAMSYEYISRNGSINSDRSVGNLKYIVSKNISLIGGFGKDFDLQDNLVTLFGINWGLNIVDSNLKI
tara:strand:- start:730526 stop:731665 length:1140 start_codon:yes stop_codon:yes gene_type:complete